MPAERTTDTSRHSPGEVRSLSPAIFVGRDRLIVSICIVLTVGLAWMYLVRLAHQMAPAMAYGTAMAAMGMTMGAPWNGARVTSRDDKPPASRKSSIFVRPPPS
jgi:predicted metal-binding membrane protein